MQKYPDLLVDVRLTIRKAGHRVHGTTESRKEE
jgi:hypothetical protein